MRESSKPGAADGPMGAAITLSRSVYRGQSRLGIGEGPGLPIAHGEQYLRNTDKRIGADGALLEDIRPWMSLDSDPQDHRLLDDRLEGWSYFSRGDLQFVVRLVSAGTYSHRRVAYFAHGRAWPASGLPAGFDPGSHLGRHEMFEEPWRNDEIGQRKDEVAPEVVRPQQVKAEGKVAVRYLAHLYQALCERYPLIIAAPISDFHTGSPLHALVSVARAALPKNLKRACKIRVYTRLPEVFLVQQQANLVVVPEAVAGDALAAAQPKPVLLDRQGQVLTGRRSLHRPVLGYARGVLRRAVNIPEGLLLFSERYQNRLGAALPSSEDVEMVPLTYNLAFAMSGSESEERRKGFIDYLLKQADELGPSEASDEPPHWQRLIGKGEWRLFPHDDLRRVLFQDPGELGAGGRKLQREVEDAAGRLALDTGDYLRRWWNAGDERKQRRLLQLLAHRPSLVPESLGVEYLSRIPIDRLAAMGPVQGVLEAERKAGVIGRRNQESVELAKLAADDQVRAVLSRATSDGALSPSWARRYVGLAAESQLPVMTEEMLSAAAHWQAWSNAPKMLFDAVRKLRVIPKHLKIGIVATGEMLEPAEHLGVYLRLADMVTRIDAAEARPPENPLIARLMAALPEITQAKDRRYLIEIALDKDWPCMTTRTLMPGGQLRLPFSWWGEFAGLLIGESAVRELLDTATLLRLGSELSAEEGEALEQLFATLNGRMSSEADGTTRVLISQGWWWGWSQQSSLPAELHRMAALKWMTCDVWLGGDAPEATLEAWNRVIEDLKPGGLSGREMQRLCGGGLGPRTWPSITPFENQQLEDLGQLATDLGALVELAESVGENELPLALDDPIPHHLLVLSGLQGGLPGDSLHWLKSAGTVWAIAPPDLTLQQAEELYAKAGHLRDRADEAWEQAVARALFDDPEGALDAADRLSLWRTPSFLSALTGRLFSLGSVADLGAEIASRIDERIDPEASLKLDRPEEIPRQFAGADWANVAEFLRPGIGAQVQRRSLPGRVLHALAEGLAYDPCWRKAAQQPVHKGLPPLLTLLAFKIRHGDLSDETSAKIRENGWMTFKRAVKRCDWLLRPAGDQEAGLPAFYLAASLLGDGAMGHAAQEVIFMDGSVRYRQNREWWRALLRALWSAASGQAIWSAEDRPDVALRLIFDLVPDLSDPERSALYGALREEARGELARPFLDEYLCGIGGRAA